MRGITIHGKQYIYYRDGRDVYGMSEAKFRRMAKSAGAVRKYGIYALVDCEVFEAYLENNRQPTGRR